VTSQNKIPANWNDGLKMADAIAKEVLGILPTCQKAAVEEDDSDGPVYAITKTLFHVGNLVGLSDLELEKAYRSKEKA